MEWIVAPMLPWLAVGTFWFVALIALEVILLFAALAWERGTLATFSLLVFLGLLQWGAGVNVLGVITAKPLAALVIAVCYLPLAMVCGTFLWWWYVSEIIHNAIEHKQDWVDQQHGTGYRSESRTFTDAELKKMWEDYIDEITPQAKANKWRLIRYMGYWPLCMIQFLFNDFLRSIFTAMYYRLATFFQRIANEVAKKAKQM